MKPVILATWCVVVLATSASICTAASCQLAPGAEAAIDMKRTGTVTGRVLDAQGNPMASAYVAVVLSSDTEPYGFPLYKVPWDRWPHMVATTRTDESGRYRIEEIATGVRYQVEATADRYGRDRAEEFVLKEGELHTVRDLVLQVGDKFIEGTVTDANGEAVARAEIGAVGPQTGHRQATADEKGRYRLENLMDEEIRISAMGPDSPPSLRGYGETTAMAGDEHADVFLKPPIAVKLGIYRVQGPVRGETSLTENIRAGIEEERRGPLQFFTLADLTIGDVTLRANQSEWTWDGKPEPPEGGDVMLVSSPRLAVLPGKPTAFRDVESVPIQYFERRDDGLFELKVTWVPQGVALDVAAEEGESGRIVLRDLWINCTTVVRRRPIEGVNLNVGAPISEDLVIASMSAQSGWYDIAAPIVEKPRTTTVSVRPGCYYGIFLPVVGQGNLIARIRVDILDPGKGAPYYEADHHCSTVSCGTR